MPFIGLFDPLYFLILAPGIILSIWASLKVRRAVARYSKVASRSGLSGAQAADLVLRRSGAPGIRIEPSRGGTLSDHYDPRAKVLRLSRDVYAGRSVASLAVAAHEAGHALQDVKGYAALGLRTAAVPVASIGSKVSWVLILGGIMLSYFTRDPALLTWVPVMLWAGVAAFSSVVAFQLVTLPVEFNASRRARERLLALGLVSREEERGVKAVLDAAALTYVAGAVTGLLTLLYYLIRLGLLGGRDHG
jgi:Zn-dependent membrane protease YugP